MRKHPLSAFPTEQDLLRFAQWARNTAGGLKRPISVPRRAISSRCASLCTLDFVIPRSVAPRARARARRPLRPTKPLLLLVPVALCNPLASTATTTYLNSSYPRTSTAASASLWTAPLQPASVSTGRTNAASPSPPFGRPSVEAAFCMCWPSSVPWFRRCALEFEVRRRRADLDCAPSPPPRKAPSSCRQRWWSSLQL